jgi:hypothetical protein
MTSARSFRVRRAVATVTFLTASCLAGAASAAQAAPVASTPDVGARAAATAGPAVAQDTSCAGGDLCFWVNTNKGGAKGRVSGNNTSWSWAQGQCSSGTWNNCASSIQNNGNNCTVNVFEDAGYGGHRLTLTRGTYISDLSGYWITYPFDSWNDDIQSNRWC